MADFRLDIYEARLDIHIERGVIFAQRYACVDHLEHVCFDEKYDEAIFREMPEGDIIVNLRDGKPYYLLLTAVQSLENNYVN